MLIMDGVEATHMIRANTRWSELPIIALTANADNITEICASVLE